MTVTPCNLLSDRMPEVVSGSVPWTAEELDHLGACQECALEWQLVQQAGALGERISASVDPGEMAAAVVERLRSEAKVVPLSRAGWWAAGLVAAAAALVLLLGPFTGPGSTSAPSDDVVRLVPELDSLETPELIAVLESFAPDTPGGVLVMPFIEDLERQELEYLLQAWEG